VAVDDQVRLRQDADGPVLRIHHRHAAEIAREHEVDDRLDAHVGPYRNHIVGHDVGDARAFGCLDRPPLR